MCASKTSRVDWKSVDGAFPKPSRLHLVEGSDGLIRCSIAGCDHPGFSSRGDVVSMQKQNIPGIIILTRSLN